jgi:hypothetical protein
VKPAITLQRRTPPLRYSDETSRDVE